MKFRCPYCHQVLEQAAPACPHCGKVMWVPSSLRPAPAGERPRPRPSKARKRRVATASGIPGWLKVTRKPRFLIWVVFIFVMIGFLLIRKSTHPGMAQSVGVLSGEAPAAREVRALANLHTLRVALEYFVRDCGRYPTTREGLRALEKNPGLPLWDGPYIHALKPDPWGRRYQYEFSNDVVRVFATGADGIAGTPDDVEGPAHAPPLPAD